MCLTSCRLESEPLDVRQRRLLPREQRMRHRDELPSEPPLRVLDVGHLQPRIDQHQPVARLHDEHVADHLPALNHPPLPLMSRALPGHIVPQST